VKAVRDATITDLDVINTANEWHDDAYTALFHPADGRPLKGDALAKVEKKWGRVDGRMIAYVYSFIDIVFVTCNMSSNELPGRYFQPTVLYIDEAGQATDADIAIPLMRLKNDLQTVFLSGDNEQLPPIIVSEGSNEYSRQIETSLFKRIKDLGTATTTNLRYSYRFPYVHCKWISDTFYHGLLQSKVTMEMREAGLVREFVKHHLYKDFSSARLAIDMGKTSTSMSYNDSFSHHNPTEANAVLAVCRDLIGRGVCPGAIWILTPYSGQSQYIEGLVNAEILLEGVRVNTITESQGGEAPVVLMSFVGPAPANKDPQLLEWIADQARLCVSISR